MRRMRRSTKQRITLSLSLVLSTAIVAALLFSGALEGSSPYLQKSVAYAQDSVEVVREEVQLKSPLDGLLLDTAKFVWEGDFAYQELEDGRRVRLTLIKSLQETLQNQMDERSVPYGSVAAIEPATGRVLALVSSNSASPKEKDYVLRAKAPSASVFKLITAAALLEYSAIDVNARVCYSGGSSMLTEADVRGNPATDKNCATLEEAIGHSINAVMARLAYQSLDKAKLDAIALKFGFNREIPFEIPVDISDAEFVDDNIERAKTAAGFWHVNLSALHGALIAAAIANRGVMMRPSLVDSISAPDGKLIYRFQPQPWLVSMSSAKADTLSKMGENTTTQGSARRLFAARSDWPSELRVGGKTGTLSNKRPFYLFNWFVGWAPLENPKIAVGALVVNTERWWIKGTHVASRAILHYYKNNILQ
ncbi:MAG: penicillin-binding transpeptidase domain-containing protein [Bradymonadales bacterium]|jgi:peptidoglycan glycosyltransferase